MPRHVEVIIPARDEEQHIDACLKSIGESMVRLRLAYPTVSSAVTVVLDRCSDGTGESAARHGARVVAVDAGCVGTARRTGAALAIAHARRISLCERALWLANTDADTVVPNTWLVSQVRMADTGADAVIGTVTPEGLEPATDRLWRERHHLAEGHDHVHGANLGMRASVYLAAGGFAEIPVHEDRDLVDRVKTVTRRWVATHRTSVTTSARALSRVDGGFASYVADLANGSSCA